MFLPGIKFSRSRIAGGNFNRISNQPWKGNSSACILMRQGNFWQGKCRPSPVAPWQYKTGLGPYPIMAMRKSSLHGEPAAAREPLKERQCPSRKAARRNEIRLHPPRHRRAAPRCWSTSASATSAVETAISRGRPHAFVGGLPSTICLAGFDLPPGRKGLCSSRLIHKG